MLQRVFGKHAHGIGKERMQLRNHRSALPDRRANAFYGSVAHVADSENAELARFQRHRIPHGIKYRSLAVDAVYPGQHKTLVIKSHTAVPKPTSRRIGTDKKKNVVDRFLGFTPGWIVSPAHPLQ